MNNTLSNYIFTSESVSAGHPDKVADQISDALVDAGLKNGDETTRVAVETLVTTNHVTVAGEVKNFNVSDDEVEKIVRDKVREIGYEQDGFHWDRLEFINKIHAQSGDIGLGTDDFGAGDQGIMFGYACDDTPSFMPAPIHYSHEILKGLNTVRLNNTDILKPDAKSQVSIKYIDGTPAYATNVVCSTQHAEGKGEDAKELARVVMKDQLGELYDAEKTNFFINPTGNFVVGGPDGDTGITGRKIIVDTYGGYAPHGGGAFSGKDPTKVDRSAAYMARWLARQAVEMGYAKWATIQLSYAIGIKAPMAVYIDCNQEANKTAIENWVSTKNLQPLGIIRRFDLFKFTEYSNNCTYGHFGNKDVPWEKQ